MPRVQHNWNTIKRAFVSGKMSLRELSREHTEIASDPGYERLRAIASKEDWTAQRKVYQHTLNTVTAQQPEAQAIAENTEKLIDAAELITRHVRLAKAFQSKIVARLQTINPEELKPSDLIAWLKISTDIERLANGMAIDRQDITSSDRSLSIVRVVIDPKNGNQETAY